MARRQVQAEAEEKAVDSETATIKATEKSRTRKKPATSQSELALRPVRLEPESKQSLQQSARKQIRLVPIHSVATQRTRFDLGPNVVVAEIPAPTRPQRTTMSPSKYVLNSSPMSSSSSESESDVSNFDFSENPDSSSSISDATEARPDDLTRQIRRKLFTTQIQPKSPSKDDATICGDQNPDSTLMALDFTERPQSSSSSLLRGLPTLIPTTLSFQPTAPVLERPCTPPPLSPSKFKLISPSKTKLISPSKQNKHVPAGPRTSVDGFWSVERVNNWNDQHSPQKVIKSPKKNRFLEFDESASPLGSPQKLLSPSKREAAQAKKAFEGRKVEIAKDFFRELDERITDGQVSILAALTGGVQLIWSKTLNSTAGRANWRKETTKTRKSDGSTLVEYKHFASIELAEKVIDDEVRLLNVIAHEFCHLANFMVLGIKDRPHGAEFKAWGRKCTAAFGDRGVEVTTKHTYEIDYKYIWACTGEDCDLEYKRHSKSIDPTLQSCGSCKAKLVQIKPAPRKAGGGKAIGYAAYVKTHFAAVKLSMPGAAQKDVMAAVGEKYRAEKAAAEQTQVAKESFVDVMQTADESPVHHEDTAIDQLTRELEDVLLAD